MRFNFPTSYDRKCARIYKLVEKYTNWKLYFAWYPVRAGDGMLYWLEIVERKTRWSTSYFEQMLRNGDSFAMSWWEYRKRQK